MIESDVLIQQCIFVWFPINWTQLHTFPIEQYLKKLTCPTMWIQKTDDPAGKYTTIADKLWSISPAFTCKEIPGEDHEYNEVEILKQIILATNTR